jgi:hypothetical protein
MSGEVEAAGAAVTAGLVAGAIDNHVVGKAEAHGACANCGAGLTGVFCASCGQTAHIHRTLGHMVEEFLHGILHFDTRAWRTLPLLVFRPGTLTRDYIHGKRAKYISPLAIFLLTVFTMFFVFSLVGPPQFSFNSAGAAASIEQVRDDLARLNVETVDAQAALVNAQTKLAAIPATAPQDDPVREAAVDAVAESEGLAKEKALELQGAVEALAILERAVAEAPVTADEAGQVQTASVGLVPLYDWISEAARNGQITVNTGFKSMDKKILEKLKNPELAFYKIQNAAYKFSFLLVPISLPFMWLLFFWKRGLTLFDHTVVTLYSLSFMSVLFVLGTLASMLEASAVAERGMLGPFMSFLVLAVPVHMYFHIKGAYGLGWFSALWRTFFLLMFCVLALSVFFLAIVALGLAG